jgi:xylan 1,4-beta-xylosidase
MIVNPIIPGFHPDPSIVRVGTDYYIAVSTFEWFPGVLIYHSKNLAEWKLVARPLHRRKQLDMVGNPDSGGVWAPCLSYDGTKFYLVYTDVKSMKGMWRDMHNYLVMANSVTEEWSDPIPLNGVGHDPSLFHDDDGRVWLVQVSWDFVNGKNRFGGISLQEYDKKNQKLVGQRKIIFSGTGLGFTEAPHIYKHNGMYHLMVAEGGTWYQHCACMARSQFIDGQYEMHPYNPILTSRDDESAPLQKAGHACLVEATNGDWYMVHLCGRPLTQRGRCVLGRETAIQKVVWKENGWLYLANGGRTPDLQVEIPDWTESHDYYKPIVQYDDFDGIELNPVFQTLRRPLGRQTISLTKRAGYLRLRGAESLSSMHKQALIARRQQSFCYQAATCLEFRPTSSQHLAGLVAYYNTDNYAYACVSFREGKGVVLRVIHCNRGECSEPLGEGLAINETGRYHLQLIVERDIGKFSYENIDGSWISLGPNFDYSRLSDDFITGRAFTGTFIGLCCQDLSEEGKFADFDWFKYVETDSSI